jgi:hypothetical protein
MDYIPAVRGKNNCNILHQWKHMQIFSECITCVYVGNSNAVITSLSHVTGNWESLEFIAHSI